MTREEGDHHDGINRFKRLHRQRYLRRDRQGLLQKRQLKRTAGAFGLWAIGISAVVSGDFSGWNGGIAQAGWGGMLIAAIVVYLMYVLMLNSISEMASAMPHTGGAYCSRVPPWDRGAASSPVWPKPSNM